MTKEELSSIRVKSCDPALASIVNEYLNGVSIRGVNKEDVFEIGTLVSLRSLYKNKQEAEERRLNGVLSAIHEILESGDKESAAQRNTLISELDQLVFLHLSESNAYFDQFNEILTSYLRLDFSREIMDYSVNSEDRNILNFFSFAFNALVEKLRESSVSRKLLKRIAEDRSEYDFLIALNEGFEISFISDPEQILGTKGDTADLASLFPARDFKALMKGMYSGVILTETMNTANGSFQCDLVLERIQHPEGQTDEIDEYLLKGTIKRNKANLGSEFLNFEAIQYAIVESIASQTMDHYQLNVNDKTHAPVLGNNVNFTYLIHFVIASMIENEFRTNHEKSIDIDFELVENKLQVTLSSLCHPFVEAQRNRLKDFLKSNGWACDLVSIHSGTFVNIRPIS